MQTLHLFIGQSNLKYMLHVRASQGIHAVITTHLASKAMSTMDEGPDRVPIAHQAALWNAMDARLERVITPDALHGITSMRAK